MQQQDLPQPRRPTHMPELAERCLHQLAESGLSNQISLGGALGLSLVERGAPRDFRDIFEVCRNGLRTPAEPAWPSKLT